MQLKNLPEVFQEGFVENIGFEPITSSSRLPSGRSDPEIMVVH